MGDVIGEKTSTIHRALKGELHMSANKDVLSRKRPDDSQRLGHEFNNVKRHAIDRTLAMLHGQRHQTLGRDEGDTSKLTHSQAVMGLRGNKRVNATSINRARLQEAHDTTDGRDVVGRNGVTT